MSSSTRGGGTDAPSNTEFELNATPESQEPEAEEQPDFDDAPDEEYDHLYGPAVEVGGNQTPDQAPGQVDQFSDPIDAPEEFDMEYVRSQGITGFIVKVSSRLRTLKDPHERAQVRHIFWDLMRQLKVDNTAQPPYNHTAAYQIRQLLEERGRGETLLLDFELLLNVFEEQAQKNREQAEQKAQKIEEEQRKKQEWDVVKKTDAEDEWEMI